MKPWIKSGLVGGGVLAFFTLVSTFSYYIPQLGMTFHTIFNCCYYMLLYPSIGIIASVWMPSYSSSGESAKYGAKVGLLAGIIDSVVTIISSVAVSIFGGPGVVLNQLPQEYINQYNNEVLELILSPVGMIGSALCSSIITITFAVISVTIICMISYSIKKKGATAE